MSPLNENVKTKNKPVPQNFSCHSKIDLYIHNIISLVEKGIKRK